VLLSDFTLVPSQCAADNGYFVIGYDCGKICLGDMLLWQFASCKVC